MHLNLQEAKKAAKTKAGRILELVGLPLRGQTEFVR